MTRRWRLAASAAALALCASFASGCTSEPTLARPDCGTEALTTLALIAQSVQSASMIPCLRGIPAGWSFEKLAVRQNRSELTLGSDRAGDSALAVTLKHTCSTAGAVQVPSDEPQTQRYENVLRVTPSYVAIRSYVFDGGCVTYHFDLATDRPSLLVNEATVMVGFATRTELRAAIRRDTHGVVKDGP